MGILGSTIDAIDESDDHPIDKYHGKVAAINAVGNAAAYGDSVNEARKLRPDVQVHSTTHTNWGYTESPVPKQITSVSARVNPVPVAPVYPGIYAAAEVNPKVEDVSSG